MRKIIFIPLIVLAAACSRNNASPGNLITNSSAELPKYDSVPGGWQNVQGHWSTLEGDSTQHSYGFAQEGKHFFFAGNGELGILQQDVDVLKYASDIDRHNQLFVFKGYTESLDQGSGSDQAMIVVKALDSSKTKTLYSYQSDTTRSLSKWLPLTDSFVAPIATRFIRVQLISIRHVGGDNDGYFDNIILTTETRGSFFDQKWWLIVLAVFILLAALSVVLYKKKKNKK